MYAQKLREQKTQQKILVILVSVLGFYSTQLLASDTSITYKDFTCSNNSNNTDPQVTASLGKGLYEDDVSFNLSYTVTLKKKTSNTYCEEAKKLMEERFKLDIEIRKLELQKLKQSLIGDGDLDNDW